MTKTQNLVAVFSAAALSIALSGGCSESENLIDCGDICSSLEGCNGDGFDAPSCITTCGDSTTPNIEACDACLDTENNSCEGCTEECAELNVDLTSNETN